MNERTRPNYMESLRMIARAERAKKERELNSAEDRKGEVLQELRLFLKKQYQQNGQPVSADDARKYLHELKAKPGPWMGALFREKGWVRVGDKMSESALQHGSRILTWAWEPR